MESPEPKQQSETMRDLRPTHVNDFLTVPGADMVLMSRDGQTWSVSRLAALLNRLNAQDENRRVEFWIKLEG